MSKKILQDAFKHNDVISFKKNNENGLELWYSGYVKGINETLFDFDSIYGNSYKFNLSEIHDIIGPESNPMEDAFAALYEQQKGDLKYLTFDTETTGLPKNFKAPVTDTENWPRVIQLAWSVHDDNGEEVEHKDILIRPEGFEIPEDSTKVHGISTAKALMEGISLREALEIFSKSVNNSNVLIAHNIEFDLKVLACEFYREKMNNPLEKKIKICTKETSVDFCKIPARNGGYRWASLIELYKILFNEEFDNQHNASNDVRACAKCFFELKNRNVIRIH